MTQHTNGYSPCKQRKETPNMKGEMKMKLESQSNKRLMTALCATLIVLTLFVSINAVHATASVWTDKADYSPEMTVLISGSGFERDVSVTITVQRPDDTIETVTVQSDDSGAFADAEYQLDGILGTYYVEATDGTNTATTTFTDVNTDTTLNSINSGNPLTPGETYAFSGGVTPNTIPDGSKVTLNRLPSDKQCPNYGEAWVEIASVVTGHSGGNVVFSGTFTAPAAGAYWIWAKFFATGGGPGNYGTSVSACQTITVGEVPPQPPPAAPLTVTKTAAPEFSRTFTWGISKSVDNSEIDIADGGLAKFNYAVEVTHDVGTDSGWQVTGTITVTNPNVAAVSNVNVADSINDANAICVVTDGLGATIPASGSSNFPYTCTYSAAPTTSSKNTATATWLEQQLSNGATLYGGSASGTADFAFTTPTTIVDGSVTVTDTLDGTTTTLGTVSHTDPSPTWFTYSHEFSGVGGTCTNYDNTAAFTTDTTGKTGSASQSVKVCVGVDLKVSKTATPYFTRTYLWSISKSVDRTLVEQIGGTATFNYQVIVAQTGFTDSDWYVTGIITVTNPNDWEDIVVDVTDAVSNAGACIVTDGTGVTVPAGQSVDRSYVCTYASQPEYGSTVTNTATASWDKAIYFTPSDSASGKADFVFSDPTTRVNQVITVTDTFDGVTTTLGTLTATNVEPYASATFNYSHTVPVPQWDCLFYTNTAKIVETGQSASQTVEVCGPAKTGALSKGFWQNKNGQGIIKSGASTGLQLVCNSGTWLRQYAPFQDLSPIAKCGAVATYVLNVVKAADARGASMNKMLKAQMLATALDVYFSDPALGGNRINARAPIGGVTIDLTHVCKMIDQAGGVGKCSNVFEDVSSAFGGDTSMTISEMLAYAASQSNSGGTNWYGNVKATQELAKDAFDAIDNQCVFSP